MSLKLTHNYHTHTKRCGHAEGTDREYVEAAIKAGIKELGFSDHVPYPRNVRDGFYAGLGGRMSPEQTSEYVNSLKVLREEYKDKIDIKIGYEAEYLKEAFEPMLDNLEACGYDYLILGQHDFWCDGEFYGSYGFTDNEKLFAAYVEAVTEGIATGKYSYVCHPDFMTFTGDDKIYEKHVRTLLKECRKTDIPLEVNMWGAFTDRHYPSNRFFEIAAEEGNKVIIGCDAHSPKVFGNTEVCEKVSDFIVENGLTLIESL